MLDVSVSAGDMVLDTAPPVRYPGQIGSTEMAIVAEVRTVIGGCYVMVRLVPICMESKVDITQPQLQRPNRLAPTSLTPSQSTHNTSSIDSIHLHNTQNMSINVGINGFGRIGRIVLAQRFIFF